MEDWLKDKLENEDAGVPADWTEFEQKLERALFFKQLRVGALMSVVLILISIAFFGGSSFLRFSPGDTSENYPSALYQGRGSDADFNKALKEDKIQSVDNNSVLGTSNKRIEELQITKIRSTTVATISVNTQLEEEDIAAKSRAVSTEPAAHESGKEQIIGLADNIVDNAEEPAVISETNLTPAIRANNSPVQNAVVETEVNVNQEPAMPEESILNLATKNNGSSAGGFSLFPDGKSTSNYKQNTTPTALMFDWESVSNLTLRDPIAPVRLSPSKPKKAYVSPLQEKNPWSYSIKVYPNFTYRKFSVSKEKLPYIHSDFIDQVEASESVGFSLNIGFEASKRIGRITYLNFGAEYISYKTEANFDFMNYRDAVVNTASGEITRYEMRHKPEHIVIVDANRYHYLNFPVSISYKPWATDHVRINIEGGASYMHFMTASGKSLDYQNLEIIDLKDREFRNSIGSIFMKVGATYHVSQQFSLGFEPTVVYFTNTIYTEEYPFEVIPYSMGLNLKLQMKLN